MRPKKAAELNEMLKYFEDNKDVMFRDLVVAFPNIKKPIINSNLCILYERGCISKQKADGMGNLCKYNFEKSLDYVVEPNRDWEMLVSVFNNLVRMRWSS